MILTLFDTIGGHRAYNVRNSIPGRVDVAFGDKFDTQSILDDGMFVMPRHSQGLVIVSRYSQQNAFITWIGVYRPLPTHLHSRSGDYFGVGVFVVSSNIDGYFIIQILDSLLDKVQSGMSHYQLSSWNDREVYDEALDKSPDLQEIPRRLKPQNTPRGLSPSSSENCGVDLDTVELDLGALLNDAQSSEAYRHYGRLLVLRDAAALNAVDKRAVDLLREVTMGGLVAEAARIDTERAADRSTEADRPTARGWAPETVRGDERGERMTYADALGEPAIAKGTLALLLSIFNTIALAGLVVALSFGYLTPMATDGHTQSGGPPRGERVEETAGSPEIRSGEGQSRPTAEASTILTEAQGKTLRDLLDATLADSCAPKPACIRRQLEQARDILRPPPNSGAPKPGVTGGSRMP